jgi:HK97 family phage portal protein
MPLLSFFKPKTEQKASRTAPLTALSFSNRASWSSKDMRTLTKTGFAGNPLVYRAIRMLAESAATLTLTLRENGQEHLTHPLLTLLDKPNARQTKASFFETLYGHLLVSGNAYIEHVSVGDAPLELYCLRPDLVKMTPSNKGWADSYEYTVGLNKVVFKQEGNLPPILHLTLPHPLDDHHGFSPLEAASSALDIHNAASNWTKALLDNAARPSGALIHKGDNGLTEAQFTRLKSELEDNFGGSSNAGRPMVLEGGLDWKAMSLSPKDMDFIEAKHESAREIALAFGIPGDNAYANYAEANRAFYRLTILPMVTRTLASLTGWLAPAYNSHLDLAPDLDAIEALGAERESLWRRVNEASFLNNDEKRVAVGYGGGKK